MATKVPFPQAAFLGRLEQWVAAGSPLNADALPASLGGVLLASDGSAALSGAAHTLIELLQARASMHQAAFDTEVAADDLRRYQKFARPGQPSAHIVQLRQRQAAARQLSNQSRQAFNRAAAAFAREAAIAVPPRMALAAFMVQWIDANLPKGESARV
jgi:hypothetical protein